MDASLPSSMPTFVSFYAGDEHYRAAAEQLKEDCSRFGLPCDIRGLEVSDAETWTGICRKKIRFYSDMLDLYPGGIVWIDVDARIHKRPEILAGAQYDIAAFLSGFKPFRKYDTAERPNTFQPGVIHFNGTERTRAFLSRMLAAEEASTVNGTDDYFFELAWRNYDKPLAVMLLPTDMVARRSADIGSATCFAFGRGVNPSKQERAVATHEPRAYLLKNHVSAMQEYAEEAKIQGHRDEAMGFLRKAHALAPKDRDVAISYADLLLKAHQPVPAMMAIKQSYGTALNASPEALKFVVNAALASGRLDEAEKRLKVLEASGVKADVAFAQTRRLVLDLDTRAMAMRLRADSRPALWWMDVPHPGNVGDVLNPYLVEKLSGLPPKRVLPGVGILAIGSVIKFAKTNTQVWGSGTPRMTDRLNPRAEYRAVRGPLTRQLVRQSGGDVPEIYGDPAMLLPLVYRPAIEKKYRLGLIRHYAHAAAPLLIADGVKEISILRAGYSDIEAFVDEVLACEAIVSTSLHGLIVAQAYGVPTRWATFRKGTDRAIPADAVEFLDHYQAFGIEARPPLDLGAIDILDESYAAECNEVVGKPLNPRTLLEVAPFKVNPEFLAG